MSQAYFDAAAAPIPVTQQGVITIVPNGFIQDMTEPTMVHGFLSVLFAHDFDSTGAGPWGESWHIGMRVVPLGTTALSTVTMNPMPLDQGDGDWFFHAQFGLLKENSTYPPHYGNGVYRDRFEIKSARKLHEDEEIRFMWQRFIHTGTNTPSVRAVIQSRLLFRQP